MSRARKVGDHLFAIDDSGQELPGFQSTFEEFGKQSDKTPGLFWAMGLASTLYNVLEEIVIDASISERFENHIGQS